MCTVMRSCDQLVGERWWRRWGGARRCGRRPTAQTSTTESSLGTGVRASRWFRFLTVPHGVGQTSAPPLGAIYVVFPTCREWLDRSVSREPRVVGGSVDVSA